MLFLSLCQPHIPFLENVPQKQEVREIFPSNDTDSNKIERCSDSYPFYGKHVLAIYNYVKLACTPFPWCHNPDCCGFACFGYILQIYLNYYFWNAWVLLCATHCKGTFYYCLKVYVLCLLGDSFLSHLEWKPEGTALYIHYGAVQSSFNRTNMQNLRKAGGRRRTDFPVAHNAGRGMELMLRIEMCYLFYFFRLSFLHPILSLILKVFFVFSPHQSVN